MRYSYIYYTLGSVEKRHAKSAAHLALDINTYIGCNLLTRQHINNYFTRRSTDSLPTRLLRGVGWAAGGTQCSVVFYFTRSHGAVTYKLTCSDISRRCSDISRRAWVSGNTEAPSSRSHRRTRARMLCRGRRHTRPSPSCAAWRLAVRCPSACRSRRHGSR